ncbi:MAG: c-type cytochrome [Gemmatimonadetes bacterium]|nr:c-type cytochrome [Gemmatimonadota bacterium]
MAALRGCARKLCPARVGSVLLLASSLALGATSAAAQEAGGALPGKVTYDKWCTGCHGLEGKGDGAGAARMLPRPRDFTRAQYQIRNTGSGELPTDADILHIIDVGMPGTAMPGWEDVLSDAEREQLVPYLKSLSRFFEGAPAPTVMEFTSTPSSSDERVAEGKQVYDQLQCVKCHGVAGRADGPSAPTLDDDTNSPIYPANLEHNWEFNGGGEAEDVYRRLRTGLDGTPMPTFNDMLVANQLTDDQLWSLALYVRSLSPEKPPETREVITATLVTEGGLPTTPTDERWNDVERFFVPMVGQIVVKPRWFDPRIKNLWVRALHDGSEVALLVSWSDPSKSPDGKWGEFAQKIVATMEPRDEGSTWALGAHDQLVVQFPQTLPTGLERPYFLQGDARRPTYLWSWRGDQDRAVELVARGLGTGQEQDAPSQQVSAVSSWADGEWLVLFRRSLATADSAADLQLPRATAIPVAFQAWDGDNGEAGNQAAVSTWYFLALEDATPATVYVAPVLAFLLTAVLGIVVVSRAQKRERGQGSGA